MNYLFVVAHPDDESDAAGGTISKLIKEGNDVAVAIMVKQAAARRDLSETLTTDEEEAMAILGVKKVYHADFPNIKMNVVPHLELVQFIESCIDDFQAEAIVTHHPTDTNNDHVMTSYAAQAACRLFQRKPVSYKLKLFMYMETPSATEWSLDSSSKRFNPNYYVEIGEEGLHVKIQALEAYKGVMRTYPHPRSKEAYEGLAAYRGCQAGVKYAEAYEVAFETH
ncbi:PIG-L deacetylase family protein [Merdimonas faecis]